jgi:hypothetical protein
VWKLETEERQPAESEVHILCDTPTPKIKHNVMYCDSRNLLLQQVIKCSCTVTKSAVLHTVAGPYQAVR